MRKLGLIISLWIAFIAIPTHSLALGLGEIEVGSFLNQPLKAEIEVISARPGEIDNLLVSLASRDAFTRAGLSRPRLLSELRFSVRKNESGDQATILVTTRSAIKEPFLNFLIEADWSKGRVLREFTVLLDPPFFAEAAVESDAGTVAADSADDEEVSDSDTAQGTDTSSAQSSQQPIALASDATSSFQIDESDDSLEEPENLITGDILVAKGDTLWRIASQFKDSSHSMGQVMLAMQRANPKAFGNNNINNLKVGAVLRAPDADEIDLLSKQQAYAQVLEQNGLWDDYVARVSGSTSAAKGSSSGSATKQAATSSGDLTLLTPGDGDSETTGLKSDGEALNKLRAQLAISEEELDASKIEKRELESRIAELEARLSKFEELQKMVEIEDESLSQLQASQAQKASEDALAAELKPVDEEALLDELLEEGKASLQEPVAGSLDTVESPVAVVEESTLELVPEQQTVTPPAPVIITEPKQKPSSIFDGILPPDVIALIPSVDSFLADPIFLAAIGGVLLLLIILVILKRRKAGSDEEQEGDDQSLENILADEDLTPIHMPVEQQEETSLNVPTAADLGADDEAGSEDEDEFARTAVIEREQMPEMEEAPAVEADAGQDDVLNEVDVYLAYGLYDNAEELLNQNLQNDPDRADYRAKLLDTYFATKNVDGFIGEAETLKSMGGIASRYWDRVVVMGYELAPDNALFSGGKDSELSPADLEIAKPEVADFDLGGDDDDTNFSSTDFNLSEDVDDLSSTMAFGDTKISDDAFAKTQLSSDFDDLLDLDGAADDKKVGGDSESKDALEDLPDDIGELEFSFDDEVTPDDEPLETAEKSDGVDFEMPDDLDLSDEDEGVDHQGLDFSVDEDLDFDDELSEVETQATDVIDVLEDLEPIDDAPETAEADETDFEETAQVDVTAVIRPEDIPGSKQEAIDLGMEDTSLMQAVEPGEAVESEQDIELGDSDDVLLDLDDHDEIDSAELAVKDEDSLEINLDRDLDETDISEIDLGEDLDLEEDLDLDKEDSAPDPQDAVMMDIDIDSEETKTGTFAPGDFEDTDIGDADSAANLDEVDFDDIEDLMLPDDVDEVATKLDLARAFIDMGDVEGARGSLQEVIAEGTAEQQAEATGLLEKI